MLQCEVDHTHMNSGPKSPASEPEPRRVQSAARAAKRQRGRERRKMYKALAHASKGLEVQAEREKLAQGFEARAAAVAAEVRVVVKNTFFDVDVEESETSDEEIALPPAFFKTTREIDAWRRDYRKFRLGHHQGAKGEVTEKNLIVDVAPVFDLRSCVEVQSGPGAALAA